MPLELSQGQKDVLAADGDLLVKGGPGSGKTTVSILKAAQLTKGLRPTQRILFLSFARATVARVMEAIVEEETLTVDERGLIAVDTYHSFFWSMLKTHGYLTGWPRKLTVLTPPSEAAAVSHITSQYKAISRLTEAERVERKGRINEQLQRVAREQGQVCFDLFAPTVAGLLESSAKLRRLVTGKYPVIILDEFQDTNADQWRVVKALGEFSTLIALADPEQRIFDFIGADPKRLDHFVETFAPKQFDLAGDNHRSKGTEIALFGNDILRGKFSKGAYVGVVFDTFASAEMPSIIKLKGTVLAARGRLVAEGNQGWSMAVLVPTKRLTRLVSDHFRVSTGQLPAIFHDAAIDMDAAILGAEVIASLLQRGGGEAHRTEFIGLVSDYFRGKNGDEATASGINEAAAIAKSYSTLIERAAEGKPVPKNSIIVPMITVYNECQGLPLTGDPDADWTAVRQLMEQGACKRLAEIGAETRNVRLLGRGTQLRQSLSQDWRNLGGYRNALAIVRGAFVQEHFSNRSKPERGISVMNMHKAKGKQFDEVIIFEGFPRRKHNGEIVSNPNRIVRGNSRENAGSDARQNFRVSVTRAKKRTTILTPKDDVCVLLLSDIESEQGA
ncbi:UvrD-helicase domain-containing protein [Mesorhizobium abyssinicae]|uniref:DNA 3'-5' helicase II n=1 Tax=Mesorhizobium abyssinicae TaxID=1209958 RepID=A0ABU5AS19_9HYPH|nr:UvrD-helicase domain-containing protein [Mesorhizobium abyssinicae]MDX8540089.1 UvrD-helicase domain-containing protein [Mesorhizobium abyssinicae]